MATEKFGRIHSYDRAHSKEIERLAEQQADEIARLDSPTAGMSEAHEGPTTLAELQRANPPPTPPGVKREGVGGYIYPKSFEVK